MPDDVYNDFTHWEPGSDRVTGAFGIRNMRTPNPIDTDLGTPQDEFDAYKHYTGINLRQRWTIKVKPRIGSGASGYNPVQGTKKAQEGDQQIYRERIEERYIMTLRIKTKSTS